MLIYMLSRPFLLHYSERKVKREGSLNSKRLLVVYLISNVFFKKVPHKDEEQVKLDVARSFNAYPKSIYITAEINECLYKLSM